MNPSAELRGVLERIAGRFRRVRLLSGLAVGWGLLAVVGLALAFSAGANRGLALAVAGSALAVGAVCWLMSQRSARDPLWVARRIEERHPDLAALLRTAVEQQPTPDGRVGFLQASVLESAVQHSRTHNWDDTVPRGRLVASAVATAVTFALLAAVVGWLGFQAAGAVDSESHSVNGTGAAGGKTEVTVEPGDTQIEKGTPLLVTAHFTATVPAEAQLVADGSAPRAMTRNLEDPKFAGYLPAVNNDLTYRVEFANGRSETFRVTVYEHPELLRVNARLVFPSFAGMDPKTVEDVRRVTAVEGTEITLFCQLNKAVSRAVLLDEKKQELPLTVHDAAKHIYTATVKPTETQRYRVLLADADGRANKLPADIVVQVTRNLPPVVSVPRPGHDARVSPLEELPLKADIKDDFGVVRHGVSVTMAGQPPKEIVLGESAGKQAPKRVQPDHLLDFEALKAQPDQVAAYYFWAEDIGPDGKPRRTSGDMFFAEVRHFEEIFRQGEQQTREQQEREQQDRQQGQSPAAQAADQLAEMQKQIVNATWKLIRRETGSMPTDKFADDTRLVRGSQQAVIDKAGAVAEQLQGASAEDLKQAVKFMEDALKHLGEAEEKAAPGVLPTALSAEQAAYQALLKLRAREFNVTRNNSRSNSRGQQSSRSPSQQQLRQLDLADEQQRYETQSAARAQREQQAQRDREQRENQELADRLKELARRQSDLTDRVKELQSALEQARDEKKKEELQQQLKRLREQQQQMLRDTEELQERLEGEQNRDRLSDARQQVEQSRENQQKASDALEKGQLGQAVNEGTRAQRQLDAVRDQLRRDSANKFGEEMKDLRQQARQLDDKQKELTKQLEEADKPKPGLNGGADRDRVKKGLEEQKQQLDKITERAEKTVQEAEKSEPLLAQELYNTVRAAAEQKLGDSLDLARRLTEGNRPEAADAARKAAEGTEQLRKGIEKSAERVLGGQTDALKRAQKELDELSDQLNREIGEATGKQQTGPGNRNDKKPEQPGQEQADAEKRQPGQGQQQQQPGQGQRPGQEPGQGQRQPNEQQPGQGQQQQPGQGREPGQQPGQGQPGTQQPRRLNDSPNQSGERNQPGGREGGAERGQQNVGRGGPIREEGFRDWFDRMRATEDMLDDPQLRAEAAQLRERVRSAREEFKRHAKEPDWKKLQETVANPLNELRNRVAEEVRRRESPNSLVPIDRDPVPPDYADSVRRYYERLGSGK